MLENVSFITKNRFEELVEEEAKRTKGEGKGFIKNPEGFRGHLIGVGNTAEKTAKDILDRHPSLRPNISRGVVRTAGWMHDFEKFDVGDPYHDVVGAYAILTKGEKEWELVAGGSESDRKQALVRIARCLPSDYALGEELGGEDFPKGALYPEFVTDELIEQVEFLRYGLSPTKTPLDIVELASASSLEQQIALYADMVDDEGTVKERLDEMVGRYKDYAVEERAKGDDLGRANADYFEIQARLAGEIMPRVLAITGVVKELVGY